jgi:hypothetical protein
MKKPAGGRAFPDEMLLCGQSLRAGFFAGFFALIFDRFVAGLVRADCVVVVRAVFRVAMDVSRVSVLIRTVREIHDVVGQVNPRRFGYAEPSTSTKILPSLTLYFARSSALASESTLIAACGWRALIARMAAPLSGMATSDHSCSGVAPPGFGITVTIFHPFAMHLI